MLILSIRTDKPEAELGLFEDDNQLAYLTWPADRQLAETIHSQIQMLLESQDKKLAELEGIVAVSGPGSFTGLRIGISVANALGAGLEKAVAGTQGDDWLKDGINNLLKGQNQRLLVPEYGQPPHITPPKK